MKLLNFRAPETATIRFGIVLDNRAVSFEAIQTKYGHIYPELNNIESYLQNHPVSYEIAKQLELFAQSIKEELLKTESFELNKIDILPPVLKSPALLDFGLSPRHLKNAARTLIDYELAQPLKMIAKIFIDFLYKKELKQRNYRYYKGNHNAIVGDNHVLTWPPFTSYLDIEPELGIVVGGSSQDIAGYIIFNDISARDIQFREMLGMGGPAQCKDFDKSKQIGPFLVTPDEVPDPLSLSVQVKIGERYIWSGTTADYTCHPSDVIGYLSGFQTLLPGTIIGMGTIPDCCGLENDKWLLPNEKIEITIENLGSLHLLIEEPIKKLSNTHWRIREDMKKFY